MSQSYSLRPLTGAIIQARLGANRLPRKVFMALGRVNVLNSVVRRVKESSAVDITIVATPDTEVAAKVWHTCSYVGDERNVLKRYYECAYRFGLETVVRITSDCPMVPPTEIDRTIDAFYAEDADYATNRPNVPDGWDVEVFTFNALYDAYMNATEPYDLEHVTPYIKRNNNLKRLSLEAPKLSVDTKEDLERVRKFYELERKVNSHNWRDRLLCN